MLLVFSILEDIIAIAAIGVDFRIIFSVKHLLLISIIALVFTFITEIIEEIERHRKKRPLVKTIRMGGKRLRKKLK